MHHAMQLPPEICVILILQKSQHETSGSQLACPGAKVGRVDKYFVPGKVIVSHLYPYGLWVARLLCPWNSPGKNTGVGIHSLLQGIFPIQGSNLGLLHCRQSLLPEPPGSLGEPSSWELPLNYYIEVHASDTHLKVWDENLSAFLHVNMPWCSIMLA